MFRVTDFILKPIKNNLMKELEKGIEYFEFAEKYGKYLDKLEIPTEEITIFEKDGKLVIKKI